MDFVSKLRTINVYMQIDFKAEKIFFLRACILSWGDVEDRLVKVQMFPSYLVRRIR